MKRGITEAACLRKSLVAETTEEYETWWRAALEIRRKNDNRGMAKRGYSREFKPHGETGKRYLLDDIPAGLWADVKAKCKRDGISIRAVILTLLREWLAK